MYCELLGYEDSQKKVYICDLDVHIESEYAIGEMFVDFMNLDFSSFAQFYNEVDKMFNLSFTDLSNNEHSKNISVNKENTTAFFDKYPLLKQEVIRDFIKKRKWIFSDCFNYDVDYNMFMPYFNIVSPPDTVNLSEMGCPIMEEYDCRRICYQIKETLTNVHDLSQLTWKFIFEYQNTYIPNIKTLVSHPYIQLSNDDDSDYSITHELFPHILQEQYNDAFIFCFDMDYFPPLNALSAEERLYIFNTLNPGNRILYQDIKTEFVTYSKANNFQHAKVYQDLRDTDLTFLAWFKNHCSSEIINEVSDLDICSLQLYETYNLRNIVAIEFHKMIEHNVKIKKCKHCNKYFILKGDYATEYCDRIPTGEKYTCKKIAAIQARKNKVQKNPVLKEYEKAYKRNYARQANRKITAEEFRVWTEEATKKRDQALSKYATNPSDQIITDFKTYLGNK